MGIEEEADRTLFIRNLDQRVTEELLFELFLQAGPLVKTKIPKDTEGKQKTFGFATYKHEVSVPYAMQLLNGSTLFGKTISIQFRSGSSHSNSPGNSQNLNPVNTPNYHGMRSQTQLNSPPYTTPPQMQRTFSSPDGLQKQAMLNNLMWQIKMQVNGGLPGLEQRGQPAGGSGSQQHDSASPWQRSPQGNRGGGHYNRGHRHTDESGSGRHQQHGHNRDGYHQEERGNNRHRRGRGSKRHYDDRPDTRDTQDNRWRRY